MFGFFVTLYRRWSKLVFILIQEQQE